MNIMNIVKSAKAQYATFATVTGAYALQAWADVPQGVKDAIDSAKEDGLEVGWLVVGVVAALFSVRLVKGLIK